MTPLVVGDNNWTLKLTIHQLIRIRDSVDVAIDDFFDDADLRHRLSTDDVLVSNIVWVLIEEQAKSEKEPVTKEQFLDQLFGDLLDTQCEALWKEMMSFFRGPHRKAVQEMWTRIQKDKSDLAARVESGGSSGESQDSSASTPALST